MVSFHRQILLTWFKHLRRVFIVRSWWVICRNYNHMKVIIWTVLTLWGGMWMRRSIWTPQMRQNVWWIGAARPSWWIFSEKYFWRFVHWRRDGGIKGYIWMRVQVFSFCGKEEVWKHSFTRLESDWGAIRERSGSDQGASNLVIAGNLW